MKVSTDMVIRVWNDDEGVALEIGPDSDGSGLEIRCAKDYASKEWFGDVQITLHDKDFALAVGNAIIRAANEFQPN